MKMVVQTDAATGNMIIRLEVEEIDLLEAKLDNFDRRLVSECTKPSASISDMLLALERIAFRLEQRAGKGTRTV